MSAHTGTSTHGSHNLYSFQTDPLKVRIIEPLVGQHLEKQSPHTLSEWSSKRNLCYFLIESRGGPEPIHTVEAGKVRESHFNEHVQNVRLLFTLITKCKCYKLKVKINLLNQVKLIKLLLSVLSHRSPEPKRIISVSDTSKSNKNSSTHTLLVTSPEALTLSYRPGMLR